MFDTKTRRLQNMLSKLGDQTRNSVDDLVQRDRGRRALYVNGQQEVVTPAYVRREEDFPVDRMVLVPEDRYMIDVPDFEMMDVMGIGAPRSQRRGPQHVKLSDADLKQLDEIDKIGFDTPVEQLTDRQKRAVSKAREILQEKLSNYGIGMATGAVGAGLVGTMVNAAQGDDNGGLLTNPTVSGLLGAGLGAGVGGAVGMSTYQPILERQLLQKEQQLGSEAFADYYGKNKQQIGRIENGNRAKDLRRRGGRALNGAALGAAGISLMQLAQNLRNEPPETR